MIRKKSHSTLAAELRWQRASYNALNHRKCQWENDVPDTKLIKKKAKMYTNQLTLCLKCKII